VGTREDIVRAAAEIMRTEGFARATTKEIARAAGYSEATLYKHYRDKSEIFLHVLDHQLPGLRVLLAELEERPDRADVRANLEELAATALRFYVDAFPLAVSVFSSRRLLDAHRDRVDELGAGPAYPIEALGRYLAGEQRRGRIAPGADPEAMAALLLGACFQRAFLASFSGRAPAPAELAALARRLVATVLEPTASAGGG
jgi:AcrR family transcriptional regulator